MDYIESYMHGSKEIRLVDMSVVQEGQNTYTCITGKNGIGKSRFISKMAKSLTRKAFVIKKNTNNEERLFINHRNDVYESSEKHEFLNNNKKIIAISTSPFDRFVVHRKLHNHMVELISNYTYIGLRGSVSSSTYLIESASKSLLYNFLRNRNDRHEFNKTRDSIKNLGFEKNIKFILKPTIKSKNLIDHNPSKIELYTNIKGFETPRESIAGKVYRENQTQKILQIIESLEKIEDIIKENKTLLIDPFNINTYEKYKKYYLDYYEFIGDILLLIETDILKISDLKLKKINFKEISLNKASSGEQCMIVILLGIAGHIRDNSVIFIDEPEISLHPKWQEDFMPTLINAFSSYQKCQFFIATHSPQVVSGMKGSTCFVTDLASNNLHHASFFSGKSADFQLAEIFGSPGQMNEYISRLCFNLLAKMKTHKKFEGHDENEYQHLLSLKEKINKDDPTLDLILVLEEVVQHYASNK